MGKTGERVVVYASTRNQYDKMEAAAKSLLLTNVIDKVYFLTEDETYPNVLPSCIETINVSADEERYFYKESPNFNCVWTYMTLQRLTLYDRLASHDRALYLDTDTIVMDNISELFDMDMEGYYYAAVLDANVCTQKIFALKEIEDQSFRLQPRVEYTYNTYYNAGVLLCNLRALRDGTGRKMLRMINTEPLMFKDQDAINIVCENKIINLPAIYNSAPMTARAKDPKIVHLSTTKEGRLIDIYNTYKAMPWSWIEKQMELNRQREEEAKE